MDKSKREHATVFENASLPLTGMTCANCALTIQRSLEKLEGVREAQVNFASERASVSFNPSLVHLGELADTITRQATASSRQKLSFP